MVEKKQINFPRYEQYKDSGIEWIGEIPAHWNVNRLGSILRSKAVKGKGNLPLLSITREKGVIVRDIENIDENHNYIPDDLSNYKVIQNGEFGMNKMKAWQGSYGISDYYGIVSPAYYVFELLKNIDKKFFHYAIRSNVYIGLFFSASDGVRIGQWDLSQTRMKEIIFAYPINLKEQTAIAQFLDHKTAQIDRAIAIKEAQIKLLNERKQIMIQEAVTKGLDPSVPMKDSGIEWIGEIPAHWEVKKLKNLCLLAGRIGFRGYSQEDIVGEGEGALVLGPSNIKGLTYNFSDRRYLSWHKYYESPEIIVEENDLLMVKTGSTYGKVAVLSNIKEPMTINPQMVLLKDIKINSYYLNFLLNSSIYQNKIKTLNSGSGMPTMTQANIGNIVIIIPTSEEQDFICEFLVQEQENLNRVADNIFMSINKLKEYKTTLINEAVTGKIKVY